MRGGPRVGFGRTRSTHDERTHPSYPNVCVYNIRACIVYIINSAAVTRTRGIYIYTPTLSLYTYITYIHIIIHTLSLRTETCTVLFYFYMVSYSLLLFFDFFSSLRSRRQHGHLDVYMYDRESHRIKSRRLRQRLSSSRARVCFFSAPGSLIKTISFHSKHTHTQTHGGQLASMNSPDRSLSSINMNLLFLTLLRRGRTYRRAVVGRRSISR